MRTLVIGDIHGGYRGLVQLLERAEVKPTDRLVFLGDYVDGWSESGMVIQRLIELSKTNNCVFIKGNHDVWCEEWLRSGKNEEVWLIHGGRETIKSYSEFSKSDKKQHLSFFETMPLYHVDDEHRLFVHAGFTSMHGVRYERSRRNFYYDRTLWELALGLDKNLKTSSVFYPKRLAHYSEIYIGHTPTINYDISEPINRANLWNVDTGAAFTGSLSAIDIDSKVVFQSDPLMDLYPNEFGRNKVG